MTLRLTNLVNRGLKSVNVAGTDGPDQFTFDASARTVQINGALYSVNCAQMTSVSFDGGAGSDQALLVGTKAAETVKITPTGATMTGPGFSAKLTNTENTTFRGNGGKDSVTLYDSPGNDKFTASRTVSVLSGPGYSSRVENVGNLRVYASKGNDTASLTDNKANASFVGTPKYSTLSGSGYSVRVDAFDQVLANVPAGAHGKAKLVELPGDDVLQAKDKSVTLQDKALTAYLCQITGFDTVEAVATKGKNTKEVTGLLSFLLKTSGPWQNV
jgi:hypothetical protein